MITNLIAAVTVVIVTNTTEVVTAPDFKVVTVSVEEITTYRLDVPGGAEAKKTNVLSKVESTYEKAWMLVEAGAGVGGNQLQPLRYRAFKLGTNSTLVLPPASDDRSFVPPAFKDKIPPGNWTPPLDRRLNPARTPNLVEPGK